MSIPTDQVLHVGPSASADVHALDVSTTEQRVQLPDEWKRRVVSFYAVDATVYIRLGDSTVTVDPASRTTVASEVMTAPADAPHLEVPPGAEARIWVSDAFTHAAIEADGAGVLRMVVTNAEAS